MTEAAKGPMPKTKFPTTAHRVSLTAHHSPCTSNAMATVIYNILVQPLLLLFLLWRFLSRKEPFDMLKARLCLFVPSQDHDIWIHAASVGEANGARSLVEELAKHNLKIVMTANTATGRETIVRWEIAGLVARIAPADGLGATRRFLNAFNPRALVTLENEVWPGRFKICAKRAIPIYGVSTKISDGPNNESAFFGAIRKTAIARFSMVWPMNGVQQKRLLKAGLSAERLREHYSGKFRANPHHKAGFSNPFLQGSLPVLAASTHPGEEEILLDGFIKSQAELPKLRLIMAPRHSERGSEIAKILERRGVAFAQRSKGEAPRKDTLVYLADTMGEMARWYQVCPVTIIGGSFVPLGGHTPVEPIGMDSMVLHGPSIENHATAFEILHKTQAAICVQDAQDICNFLTRLPQMAELHARVKEGAKELDIHEKKMDQRTRDIVATIVAEVQENLAPTADRR